MKQNPNTLRLETATGGWKAFECEVREQSPGSLTEVYVPAFNGTWLIGSQGMTANIGGNDWRIYTVHPDDCRALCPPREARNADAGAKGATP